MTMKPDFCEACPINEFTDGYVPLQRATGASRVLAVGEAAGETEVEFGVPFCGGAGAWLNSLLRNARIPRSSLNVINVIGCRPRDNVFPTSAEWKHTSREQARAGVAYCREHHLLPAIATVDPTKVYALGAQALGATTPRGDSIFTWRGSPLPLRGSEHKGAIVIPTIHPAAIARDATMFAVAVHDLKKSTGVPPERYNLAPTPEEVAAFDARRFVFDLEWAWNVWKQEYEITMCGVCARAYEVVVAPWVEPYISILREKFENAEELIGHNIIGADLRWFEKLGWRIKAKLVDTMLRQHLIQPDYPHDLGFCASLFTNKPHWKGRGEAAEDEMGESGGSGPQWRTWDQPTAIPRSFGGYGGCTSADEAYRLYNARDNDANWQIVAPIDELMERHGLESLYWNVSLPAAYLCREMGDRGLRIDRTRVAYIREELDKQIEELDAKLPPGLRSYIIPVKGRAPAPPNTYKPRTRKCKGTRKYPHEVKEFTFTVPGERQRCVPCMKDMHAPKLQLMKTVPCERLERVWPWNSSPIVKEYAKGLACREVYNPKTKRTTSDKNARKVWGRTHPEFITIDLLKIASTRKNNFAKEALLNAGRVFYNLNVHGTAIGRLSSSGRRKGIDPNIQNQPKDIRLIFVPDGAGYGFLSADVVQGENQLTAWFAKDVARQARMNDPAYDEHSETIQACLRRLKDEAGAHIYPNIEVSKLVNKHFRPAGKKVNHMLNYKAGWKKLQEALAVEGFGFSAADCKEFIVAWRELNAGTARWQDETVNYVKQHSMLANPFGRKRWFSTSTYATEGCAFNPASTLADCVLRMMIAMHADRFQDECNALGIGVRSSLLPGWDLRIQVHDELCFHGPAATMPDMAARVRAVMEQPWPELGGFALRAEIAWSESSWGEVKVI